MSCSAPRCRPARSHTCRCSTSWRASIFAASPTAHPSTCTCSSRRRGTPSPTATASSATRTSSRRRWTGSCRESTRKRSPRSIDRETAKLEEERELQPWVAYADSPLHDPWRYDPQPRPEGAVSASPPKRWATAPPTSASSTETGTWWPARRLRWRHFGSGVVVPGTGILLSNGMTVFNPMPGAANSIAGYKRGMNNMAPVLLLRDGRPFLTVGAPGGRRIMCRIAHIISNVVDFGMSIQEAITAPSVDAAERETFVDHRIDPQTVEALARMGPQRRGCAGALHRRRLLPAARRHDRPRQRPPPRRRTAHRPRRSPGLLESGNPTGKSPHPQPTRFDPHRGACTRAPL